MFVDQADIEVFAGDGGNGCVSFRREKYLPHGGPDGGDGGDGGSVYMQAVHGIDTLLDMMGRHHWYAEVGKPGMGKKMAGKDGKDLTIKVPPGTLVYDRTSGLLIADLKEPGKTVLITKGGRGGKGNINYTSPVRQAPEFAEPGKMGQRRALHLELRMIADVGLVGLPNAGKSTLLSRISAARPKIADYPFTTLVPQLGIAELDAERRLVIADIPGLIEGANQGAGLGLDFLRHIERTRIIVHIVDVLPLDGVPPAESYRQIRRELEAYSPKLAAKPELLVANKMDLSGASEALADLRDALPGKQVLAISAVAGTGMRPLLEQIWQAVLRAPASSPIFEVAPKVLSPLMREPDTEDMTTLEMDVAAHEAWEAEVAEVKNTKFKPRKKAPAPEPVKGTRESEAARKEQLAEDKRQRKNPYRIPEGMLTIPGKVTRGRRVVSPRTTADQRLRAKLKREAQNAADIADSAARDAAEEKINRESTGNKRKTDAKGRGGKTRTTRSRGKRVAASQGKIMPVVPSRVATDAASIAEDAALAAEIAAMKADDARKGKFYR